MAAPKVETRGVTPAPKPTVYWFHGKPFYSLRAYQHAVQAANQRAAAAKPAARAKPAPLRPVVLTAAQKAAIARRQAAAQRRLARESALRRAGQIAREQESARVAQARALLASRAEEQAILRAKQASARRQQEQRVLIERRRHDAYERITKANHDRLVALMDRREAAASDAQYSAAEDKLRRSLKPQVRAVGGAYPVEPGTGPVLIRRRSYEQQRVHDALAKARKGDYKDAVDLIDEHSKATGGRHVDPQLFKAVNEGLVQPVQEVRARYSKVIERVNALWEAGEHGQALALYRSKRFAGLKDLFVKWYGDPRTGAKGAFAPLAAKLGAATARRRALVLRESVGLQPTATDAEVADVIKRAFDAAYRFTGGEAGDMRAAKSLSAHILTPAERMDRYTSFLTGSQNAAIRRQVARQDEMIRAARAQGAVDVGFTADGQFVARDAATVQAQRTAYDLFGGADKFNAEVARLQGLQQARPWEFEGALRKFMDDLGSRYAESPAYKSAVAHAHDQGVGRAYGGTGTHAGTGRGQFLDSIARLMFGRPWTGFDDFSTGFVGGVTQSIFAGASSVPMVFRVLMQQNFGSDYVPYLDVHLWGEGDAAHSQAIDSQSGTPNSIQFGRVFDKNKVAAYNMLQAAFRSGDLGQIGEAMRQYSQWGEGNLGGLLTQAVDPFQLLPWGDVGKAGALALAKAGGWRSLLRVGAGREIFPELFRGVSRVGTKYGLDVPWARLKLSNAMGVDFREAAHLSDAEWTRLGNDFREGKAVAEMSDAARRMLEKSPLSAEQLLTVGQDTMARIGKEFGLDVVDPAKVVRMVDAAERGIARSVAQAEEALSLTRARAALARSAKALERERGLMPGVAPAVAKVVPAADVAEHGRLLDAFVASTEEYHALGQHVRGVLDSIEALGREVAPKKAAFDFGKSRGDRLAALQRDLASSVRKMRKYDEQVTINPGVKSRAKGILTRQWEELQTYRRTIGGDPAAPSLAGVRKSRIASDRAWLASRVKGLQAALAAETDISKRAAIKRLLTNARSAQRGLTFEEAAIEPAKALERHAKRAEGRIAKAVRPQQIGAVAPTKVQRAAETVRSLNVRISQIAEVTQAATVSPARRKAFDLIVPEMLNRDVTALVKAAGFDWGPDVNLLDALVALRKVDAGSLQGAQYGALLKSLRTRLGSIMASAKWRGSRDQFLKLLEDEHIRAGAPAMTLRRLSELDRVVADELARVRGFRAKGLIRRGKARISPKVADARELMKYDTEPEYIVAKIRVLRDQGVSLWEYDEARAAMGDIMLKRRGMVSMAREALQRTRRTGESLDEAMSAVRDARALREAKREYVEWGLRPEMAGLTPETVLRVFEEDYISRGLGWVPDLSVTEYQRASLQAAFREIAQFTPGDTHLLKRLLGGVLDVVAPGTRAPNPGEFIDFESGVPIRVVGKNHWAAQGVPFGSRPRFVGGEGLDEAASRAALSAETLADDVYDRELISGTRAMRGMLDERSADVAAERATRASSRRGGKAIGWHERAAPDGWARSPRFADVRTGPFAGPVTGVEGYRKWLWEQMRTDADFRASLKDLRGKGLVGVDGIRAGVLADAVNYLWSEDGLRRFAHGDHAARLGGATLDRAAEIGRIKSELGEVEEALRIAHQLAGDVYRVKVVESWLGGVEAEIDRLYGAARAAGNTVDQANLNRLLERIRGVEAEGKVGLRFQEWARASTFEQFDEVLNDPELYARLGLERGVEVEDFADLMKRDLFKNKRNGGLVRPEAEWVYGTKDHFAAARVRALEVKGAALREELKRAKRGGRQRALVGVSVTNDGVYVVEGTSNVTLAHEIMHQFWDDPANAAWVKDIERQVAVIDPGLRAEIWKAVRAAPDPFDEAEFVAELYALWRVGDAAGSDVKFAWRDLRVRFGGELDALGRTFGDYAPQITAPSLDGLRFPPFGNRTLMYDWLVEHGYWSKRLGEQISAGERTWSIDEERRFFESNWGYTPPWTDHDVLAPLLNDQNALRMAYKAWGFDGGSGFEELVTNAGLTPKQVAGQLSWGGDGIKRRRTLPEMRRYAIERYGPLVSRDGRNLNRMPWLMRADDEYLTWLGDSLDEAGAAAYRAERAAEWAAARAKLPKALQDAYFSGDVLVEAGLDLQRGLVKAKDVPALTKAFEKATRRRLERLRKAGDLDPRIWLPQEQMAFAYDVVNDIMADASWRGLLRGTPVAGALLHVWGQFWRMLVSWQPAFPIMNLIESYGFKRLYLQIYHNGFRPLGWDADGERLVGNLREIGSESASVFNLRHGADSFGEVFSRVGDESLTLNVRGGALVSGIAQAPVLVSKIGEDRLRLQFARSIAGSTYRAALHEGIGTEAAESLARAEAKRLVTSFFAINAGNSGLLNALNEIVPFFSYNWKNKTLAVKMFATNPMVWVWGERFKRDQERQNRERWAVMHPGVPFPDSPDAAGQVWFTVGDTTYQVDLSNFSDWTRAIANVTQGRSAIEWFAQFVRAPHPEQWAALAWMTGGMTPWGRPGSVRELSFWADFLYWVNGQDYKNWDWKRDLLQMGSQMLFFQRFGSITPIKVKQMTYFNLQDLDPAKARAYLDANPDLLAYWASKAKPDTLDPARGISRWQVIALDERSAYTAALGDWERLNNALDARIAGFAGQPWSREYRDAKHDAFIVRSQFLAEHPELMDYWTTYMSPAKLAAYEDRFMVDQQMETFLAWKRPDRGNFGSDLAYQRALVDYFQQREDYLKAHPALAKALYGGRTAIERAWHDQELHWSEMLEMQARIQLAILKEQRAGASADRDLINELYHLKGDIGLSLDADRYAMFGYQRSRSGAEPGLARIPGFGRFIRSRQTPAERAKSDENARYARGIGKVVEGAKDGADFYNRLRRDPWLLREYWRRNPEAKAKYEAGQEYFRQISGWVNYLKRDDFEGAQAWWDRMPAWVKERYFVAHPDSGMRDGMGGGGGGTAVQYKGQWFKSPESRDRYIYYVEQDGQGPVPKGLDLSKGSGGFSSPAAKARFVAGQQYYAALGGWIKLLEKKDYVAADKYFRGLPQWMREKYWEKHPDQRARMELDSAVLRAGADYFLAAPGDRLKVLQRYPALRDWLNAHGGEEAAQRGLVLAVYQSIPSSEAWLKRTFRERFPEVFSQEAAGQRRLDSVAADLARNPEVLPYFRRAVRLQYHLYFEQLKRNKVQPKPWTLERKTRLKKRRKRRAAAFSSLWGMHQATRKYQYEDAGRARNRP